MARSVWLAQSEKNIESKNDREGGEEIEGEEVETEMHREIGFVIDCENEKQTFWKRERDNDGVNLDREWRERKRERERKNVTEMERLQQAGWERQKVLPQCHNTAMQPLGEAYSPGQAS